MNRAIKIDGAHDVYLGGNSFHGFDVPIDIVDGENVFLDHNTARQYSDAALRARNSSITARGLDFSSKQADYGIDLTRNVTANIQNSRVVDHLESDIAYGPGVVGDFHNVTASTLYDRARRRSPLSSSSPKSVDKLINTGEEQIRREEKLKKVTSATTGALSLYSILQILNTIS